MNKAILSGNLGKEPELRHLENGQAVANCSLATSKTFTNKTTDEKETRTEWHNLVIWGKQAETFAKYLKKGSKILVEGEIQNRSYEDKDGNTRYISEINVREFEFLDKKEDRPTPATDEASRKPQPSAAPSNEEEDDIIF